MTYEEAKIQIQAIPEKIWDQLSEPDREAMEMAFSALEKQIPNELIAEGDGYADMEYKLTFLYTASVLALQKAHAKVNWEKYFRYFQEIYQEVLDDPDSKVKEAEQIMGDKFEFQMPREWEDA